MPDRRVKELVDRISQLTTDATIAGLLIELGDILATEIKTTRTSIKKLKEDTTSAVVDTELTLEDHINDLRTAILGLTQIIHKRAVAAEADKTIVSDKVHSLSNHVMALEVKVNELADTLLTFIQAANDANSGNG